MNACCAACFYHSLYFSTIRLLSSSSLYVWMCARNNFALKRGARGCKGSQQANTHAQGDQQFALWNGIFHSFSIYFVLRAWCMFSLCSPSADSIVEMNGANIYIYICIISRHAPYWRVLLLSQHISSLATPKIEELILRGEAIVQCLCAFFALICPCRHVSYSQQQEFHLFAVGDVPSQVCEWNSIYSIAFSISFGDVWAFDSLGKCEYLITGKNNDLFSGTLYHIQ